MTPNRISAVLTDIDRAAVMEAINTIKLKLPFLIPLTPEDRKNLSKMGDKSRAFVLKSIEIAQQNPTMIPQTFNTEELRRDIELYEALQPLILAVNQLHELLLTTNMMVGSQAYTGARTVYHYAQSAGNVVAVQALKEAMGQRFNRRNKSNTAAAKAKKPDSESKE